MKHIYDKTPEEIYNFICSNDPNRDYIYVIFGKNGPTGKSWLWSTLHMNGYEAIETSEMLSLCGTTCNYADNQNHYILNDYYGWAIIVLNTILP